MTTDTLTSIKEIDPGRWNAIVAENHLICRHEYLHAIEMSRINDCRYFYIVLRDNDGILAHTCVYFISTELDSFATGVLKKVIIGIRRLSKSFLILRSVECGTPVALGNTISYREGADKSACLARIVSETERIARRLGVGVLLFRDFYDHELDFYDQLTGLGYRRIHNLPATRLEIKWKTFDEYLGSLRSRYRRKMQAQLRKFDRDNTTVELVKDFSLYAGDLATLWKNAYENATEYRREILLADFFENVDRDLGDRSAIILLRIDGKPVGFSLLLFDDQTLIPLFCGLDYSYNNEYCIYFNLLYSVVRTAIEIGVKDVDFGITTIAPKIDLGAIVTPLSMYMKHLNPVANALVPRLFEMMTPSGETVSRNVLRQ
jgi:predicted N-acyltransferase